MNEKRFVAHDSSVEDYLENKSTKEKGEAGCEIVGIFEKRKERRARSAHYRANGIKYLLEFIRSVGRKDEEDYEPSSSTVGRISPWGLGTNLAVCG